MPIKATQLESLVSRLEVHVFAMVCMVFGSHAFGGLVGLVSTDYTSWKAVSQSAAVPTLRQFTSPIQLMGLGAMS